MDSNSSFQNKDNKSINNFDEDFGVLLISHGSTLSYSSKTFEEILSKYIDSTGHNAEVGYMKVSEPSISKAIDNIIDKNPNINRIIAMPIFLAPGIHTNIDIPIMLGLNPLEVDPRCPDGSYPKDHYLNEAGSVNFNGEIQLINCIGPDPLVLDIINKRVDLAVSEAKSDMGSERTAVLLVSHGSRLNYNKEFIADVFNQFTKKSSYISDYAFMELCQPTISQSINELARKNDFDRLVVVPVFIAPGVHTTRDIPTILGLIDSDGAKNHNHSHSHSHSHSHGNHDHHHHHHDEEELEFDGEILYADPLGADDILIEIIKERIGKEIGLSNI